MTEITAGMYRVRGVGPDGLTMERHGPDDDLLLDKLIADSIKLSSHLPMTHNHVLATEKALLFVAIGYLEALKSDAIAFDEVFHTIGVPKIFDRMREFGISQPVADLICSLDELDPERWDEAYDAIEGVLKECRDQLAARPLTEDRANVCLKLLQPDQTDH